MIKDDGNNDLPFVSIKAAEVRDELEMGVWIWRGFVFYEGVDVEAFFAGFFVGDGVEDVGESFSVDVVNEAGVFYLEFGEAEVGDDLSGEGVFDQVDGIAFFAEDFFGDDVVGVGGRMGRHGVVFFQL